MRISRALGGVTILQKNKEDIIATDTGSTVSATRSRSQSATDPCTPAIRKPVHRRTGRRRYARWAEAMRWPG